MTIRCFTAGMEVLFSALQALWVHLISLSPEQNFLYNMIICCNVYENMLKTGKAAVLFMSPNTPTDSSDHSRGSKCTHFLVTSAFKQTSGKQIMWLSVIFTYNKMKMHLCGVSVGLLLLTEWNTWCTLIQLKKEVHLFFSFFFSKLCVLFSTWARVKRVNISVPPLLGCLWPTCEADFILWFMIMISAAGPANRTREKDVPFQDFSVW